MTEQRLYGVPGAELMHRDPATVYEQIECDIDVTDSPPLVIEEWSAKHVAAFLCPGDLVAEWVAESSSDELTEDPSQDVWAVAHTPEVVAAFDAAIAVMASKLADYHMADRKLRDMIVTWDDAGEPLLDGEPMYRQAKA